MLRRIDFAMIDYHIAYCLVVADDPACRRCPAPLRPNALITEDLVTARAVSGVNHGGSCRDA